MFVSDDEQRVAKSLVLGLERVRIELSLDHEGGAIAKPRELLVRRLDRCSLHRRLLGQRLSGDDRRDPAQQLDEARGAGVDDTGLTQDVELLLRASDGFFSAGHQELEQLGDRPRLLRLGGLRKRADRGQHRPFDRLAHRPVGGVRAAAQRPSDDTAVENTLRLQRFPDPTDDLREDDAGVPAGAHQRRTRRLARDRRSVLGGRGFERLEHRARGQRQVRAGVAVRDRIDVEVVDPGPALLQSGDCAPDDVEQCLSLGHADWRTSWMWTSTAATRRPVSRSTSYCTCERIVAATSARLSPYSTTTWRSSDTESPSPETVIPCARFRGSSRPTFARGPPPIPTTP